MNGGTVVTFVSLCMLIGLASSEILHDFTCDTNDVTKVKFFTNDLVCPDGLICNNKYKYLNKETKIRPCVAPSEICEYTCDIKDLSFAYINSVKFICDKDKECNSKKTTCDLCVLRPCDAQAYTCDETNDKKVTLVGGYEFSCKDNEICNKDNKHPCSPCIEKSVPPPSSGDAIRGKRYIHEQNILSQPFYA